MSKIKFDKYVELREYRQLTTDQAAQAVATFRYITDPWDYFYEVQAGKVIDVHMKGRKDRQAEPVGEWEHEGS